MKLLNYKSIGHELHADADKTFTYANLKLVSY